MVCFFIVYCKYTNYFTIVIKKMFARFLWPPTIVCPLSDRYPIVFRSTIG